MRSSRSNPPRDHSQALLSGINPTSAWTLGNAGSPSLAEPDPVPRVTFDGKDAPGSAKAWTTVRAFVDGVPREIEWPPGIRSTELHLGDKFRSHFGVGVYKDFHREMRDGMIASSDLETFNVKKKHFELFIMSERGGVWWALKTTGRSPRVAGCGFLAVQGTKLIVQSAMMWRVADRKLGLYPIVLQRLREWARPGTVYSDVCMSAQAVMSWNTAMFSGVASWDEKEGRYRRNPRNGSRRIVVRRR